MAHKSLVSVLNLTKKDVLSYIFKATQMKNNGPIRQFPNKTLINMFYLHLMAIETYFQNYV